jgi:hypothetical protein
MRRAGEEVLDDPLVQRLKKWEATPKDSPERLEALRRELQTLDEEFQVKEDEPGVVYVWNADRVFVWREAEGWNESRRLSNVTIPDIEDVTPVEPFKLRVTFSSGHCRVVDIRAMRGTHPMFAPLWNWDDFKKVRFTPDVVEWFRGLKKLEVEGQDLWADGNACE